MPIYEFLEEETGATVDVHFPAGSAPDSITLKRVRVPRRIGTTGIARVPRQGDSLIEGYAKLEQAGQFKPRPGGFTAEQIKHAASLPDL